MSSCAQQSAYAGRFLQGQSVDFELSVQDRTGAFFDPAVVTAKSKSHGVVSQLTPARVALGIYRVTVELNSPGDLVVRWEVTGGACEERVYVQPSGI